MKLRLLAFKDLLSRYAQVFQAAWGIRHQLDPVSRRQDELAFLPAHLELADTPVHPAPKWAMRSLVAFAVIATLWAIFGQLDIVVTANGKLVPSARVKVVQPLDAGIVRAIYVQDGQRVKAGQPLLELDATQANADFGKAHAARFDAALTAARAQALLTALQTNRPPQVKQTGQNSADLPADRLAEVQRFAEGQYNELRAKVGAMQAELSKREAELATARHEIDRLAQTAPLAKQAAESYRELVKNKYVSEQEYRDKEQARIEQEHGLAAQQSHAKELQAAIDEQRAQISATLAQFKREQLDQLNQAQQQLTQNTQEETKASQRQQRLKLTAPIDGTVQQLNVHTIGGVVTLAQTLMTVVPDDTLQVEANVENKDIGFVNAGQTAAIKVQAFPYTRYGYLTGTVTQVSNDAAQDKKGQLTFPLTASLPTSRMHIENKWVNLTPGMAVTVEIRTGKRRVGEYFLSPLVAYASESLRER